MITALAALHLVEAGRLELDQAVVGMLPELADRRVLRSPTAALEDTVPARRAITLRHLLTNTSGYGMVMQPSPLQQAMAENGTEAGPEPPALGADEWLGRLARLPLAFHPGEGWRYHHSFGVLGILISRVTGRPLGEHLAEDVLGPLGMTDTALSACKTRTASSPGSGLAWIEFRCSTANGRTPARPIRLVRRPGNRLLRRPGRHDRHPPHPG